MKHVPQLDGIRGLAVFAVLMHHYTNELSFGIGRNMPIIAFQRVLYIGWLGVDIFFVLSGFLITGIIFKERSLPDFWRSFYLRRTLRIVPAFVVVFYTTVLAVYFLVPSVTIHSSYIWFATFFMANWAVIPNVELPMITHIWSLAVEEQFYFLWPQAAKRLRPVTILKVALVMAGVCELIRVILFLSHVNAYIVYKITPTRVDGLAIGAALAASMTLPAVKEFLSRHWRTIAVVAASIPIAAFIAYKGSLFLFEPWVQVIVILPVTVLTATTIFASIQGVLPSPLLAFFTNPVMRWLGRRSYGLYLIHEPVRFALNQLLRRTASVTLARSTVIQNVLFVCLGLGISLILTEISWRLVEAPAQNLRRSLMRKKPPAAGLPAAPSVRTEPGS